MKKISLLFLITISASVCVADEYQNFRKYCIEGKYKNNFKAQTGAMPDYMQSTYVPVGPLDNMLMEGVTFIVRRPQDLDQNMADGLLDRLGLPVSRGERIRQNVIRDIRGVIVRENLNSAETMCLIQCAANNIMRLKFSNKTRFSSVKTIYAEGVGNCAEMTEVAIDLAEIFDFDVRREFSKDHVFMEAEVDGRWVVIDPTVGICTQYDAD